MNLSVPLKPLTLVSVLAGIAATSFVVEASPANAATITFTEFNPPGISSQYDVTNEYQPQGITLTNWYRYIDGRDTNDQVGISLGPIANIGSEQLGLINFINPVKNLSIEWWTISSSLTIKAYDAANNLLATLNNLSGGNTISFITNQPTSRLEVQGDAGFGQITTLTFDEIKRVPEPITVFGLVATAGVSLALRRKSQPQEPA